MDSQRGGAATGELVVNRVDDLSVDHFAEMLAESEAAGYRFLRRVLVEWESGVHRFSRPGEALLVAEVKGRWVGVCGLSIDPYLEDPRVGRVRNVYVLRECRGSGVGRLLVLEAISRARGHFDRLRLRAEKEGPARIYESVGFERCGGVADCTHMLELGG
jgi:GNAT superfamily N-acetyltransferase